MALWLPAVETAVLVGAFICGTVAVVCAVFVLFGIIGMLLLRK